MNKTLPAIPIIDRVWLDSACQGGHLGRRFPHTVLVGALVHSAVFIPSLRHRCTELWSIAVNLLDNEYRQPRLQTLQLALLEIYGWPVSNPGGTHIAISRVGRYLCICCSKVLRPLDSLNCSVCTVIVLIGSCHDGRDPFGSECGGACISLINGPSTGPFFFGGLIASVLT